MQELIAPRCLIFLDQAWRVFGTKADLADLLETIASIHAPVLKLQQNFVYMSIAQCMSWAAHRRTTREEDRAYSLFGIFGINVPTFYGEGQDAFQRLREEILRRYTDTTLFAWSTSHRQLSGIANLDHDLRGSPTTEHCHLHNSYLFAPSPSAFHASSHIHFSTQSATVRRLLAYLRCRK